MKISNCNSYMAVIGDIVNSKSLLDRSSVQQNLQRVLNDINRKYAQDIASKFMITLGDEFQGLLHCGENLMNIISETELQMYPVKLRFGIGIGEIITEINPEMPLGSDGPAYHRARKMIDNIKINETKNKTPKTNIMILSDNDFSETDIMLNSIFSLSTAIKRKWSERQHRIILEFIQNGENQLKTAQVLGITQSSVNKGLNASDYYTYVNALNTISQIL